MTTLIGIGGRLASGKDTAADYLVEHYGFVKLGMSDPLLEAAQELNPWIPMLDADVPLGHQFPFTTLSKLVQDVGYTEAKKNVEVRRFLQALGTDIGRNMISENVWVDIAGRKIDQLRAQGLSVVITGLRFPNEIAMVRARGGATWWVEREAAKAEASTHASENGVKRSDFDRTVENFGTIYGLYASVEGLLFTDEADARIITHPTIALTPADYAALDAALHTDLPAVSIHIAPSTERHAA